MRRHQGRWSFFTFFLFLFPVPTPEAVAKHDFSDMLDLQPSSYPDSVARADAEAAVMNWPVDKTSPSKFGMIGGGPLKPRKAVSFATVSRQKRASAKAKVKGGWLALVPPAWAAIVDDDYPYMCICNENLHCMHAVTLIGCGNYILPETLRDSCQMESTTQNSAMCDSGVVGEGLDNEAEENIFVSDEFIG